MTELDLETARSILDGALAEAAAMQVPMAIAICDAGGHLLSFARMDGCMILAAETAPAKARAAVYFRRPTDDTVERSRRHPTVYGSFVAVAAAPIVLSMGGVPLWCRDGSLAGAVAAAGGTGEEDGRVSAAGERRWRELLDVPAS